MNEVNYQNFEDTMIKENFAMEVETNTSNMAEIATDVVHYVVETIFMAMSDYAKVVKTKEKPIAVVIDDLKGNFLMALKVEYIPGIDENTPGSWNPAWTFNKEDIEGCIVYTVRDNEQIGRFFAARGKTYRMTFSSPTFIYAACLSLANALVKWLDDNENETTPTGIDLPGFFKASVTVIDGIKEFALSVYEEISNLVKDDPTLQTM